jgi:hypothetical protein
VVGGASPGGQAIAVPRVAGAAAVDVDAPTGGGQGERRGE